MDRMRIDLARLIAKHQAAGDESSILLFEYHRLVEASINDAVDEIAAKPLNHRVRLLESLIVFDLLRLPTGMRNAKIGWLIKTSLIPQERLLKKIKSAAEAMGVTLDGDDGDSKIAVLHEWLKNRR